MPQTNNLPVIYSGCGPNLVNATLRRGSVPGTWGIWPDNPTDSPRVAWSPSGLRIACALESNLSAREVANLYPDHADVILGVRDSSD
jgi:hypothetical protein